MIFEGKIIAIGGSKGIVIPKPILLNLKDYEGKQYKVSIEEVK